jgi:spermidine/putrescine transport system permease protein
VARSLTLRRAWPWLLLLPGLTWLAVFFAFPALNQAYVSLQTGNAEQGFQFTWAFDTYVDAISTYHEQFARSILYAGAATVLALIIAFPLAYFIAFKAGRWQALLLVLVILPFFTSYLVRTVAWQTILADDGTIVGIARSLGIVSENGRLLATGPAVVAGITYNFLPFMVLPLYVALERIDPRMIEAATDLYADRAAAFRRVTLPLALPGVFAGSLLTFIPAAGDFVNATLLGSSRQYMIGNVIQSQFLTVRNYPVAAAISFVLMGAILVLVALYVRLLGRRTLEQASL